MYKMSGSLQSAMLSALKALDSINSDAEPTDNLKSLIYSSNEQFSTTLAQLTKKTYSFIFNDSIDLKTVSGKKVEEKFKEAGASGSTLTKCIAFFLAITKDANISVSPYVKAPKLNSSTKIKTKSPSTTEASASLQNELENTSDKKQPDHSDMVKITVPLRDTNDAVIYFPKNMDDNQIKQAVKMADFILKNYYGIE